MPFWIHMEELNYSFNMSIIHSYKVSGIRVDNCIISLAYF